MAGKIQEKYNQKADANHAHPNRDIPKNGVQRRAVFIHTEIIPPKSD
jgi:hypothetical protein